MTQSVGMMLQGVLVGMESYQRYDIERNRLLESRERYAQQFELERSKAEIETKKFELEKLGIERQNKMLDYELAQRKLQNDAAPMAAYLASNLGAEAVTLLQETDPAKAMQTYKDIRNNQDAQLAALEAKNPGITAAVRGNKILAEADGRLFTALTSKLQNSVLTDPLSNTSVDAQIVKTVLDNPGNATTAALSTAVGAMSGGVNASKYSSLLEKVNGGLDELKRRADAGDSAAQKSLFFLDVSKRSPEALELYKQGKYSEASDLEARNQRVLQDAMDRAGMTFGGGSSKPVVSGSVSDLAAKVVSGELSDTQARNSLKTPEARKAYDEEMKFGTAAKQGAADRGRRDTEWSVPFRSVQGRIEAGDAGLKIAGLGEKDEVKVHEAARDTVRGYAEQQLRVLATAKTKAEYDDAAAKLEKLRKDPASLGTELMQNRPSNVPLGWQAKSPLNIGLRGSDAKEVSTEAALSGAIKEASNGRDYLPATLKSVDFVAAPEKAASLTPLGVDEAREAAKYQLRGEAAKLFSSPAALALWVRAQNVREGNDPMSFSEALAWAADVRNTPWLLEKSGLPKSFTGPALSPIGGVQPATTRPGPATSGLPQPP
jgi:hypothetical protein